ncbi:MAG: hypothetical protein JWP65_1832 [Ramlibacter sp.]|jgi:hypothetical protein|uniref:hypothetical protein n=1 Tax=Ramlibacter sp. TaxID=1917967 RepID=UPI002611956C|nr:hypothetical protein [Ramlibacter sp.]MDB5751411.1 hypothetical protein [Ramlibacter sp.]
MSASQGSALNAVAFQLAATLESYEEDVGRLMRSPLEPDLYRRVSRHVDLMRMYAASFPSLSVAWIEVLIRHFELTHGLWREQSGQPAELEARLLHLRAAIARLRMLCLRVVASS